MMRRQRRRAKDGYAGPARHGIGVLRAKIDRIDEEIIGLVGQRAQYAREIGRIKRRLGLPIYDPTREKEILERFQDNNQTGLSNDTLRAILREIISACRSVQSVLRVAYLGPEGTFAHAAALKCFGRGAELAPFDTMTEVFEEVESGGSSYGVVPIENSTEGSVGHTMDLLAERDIPVCGEVLLKVSHALMSKEPSLDLVTRIYSHPQALAQCGNWLARHLFGRERIPTESTAAAAVVAGHEKGAAVVGSVLLAERYGLKVLAEGIQDRSRNATRFFILGRGAPEASGKDKTSMVFATKHRPGMLHRALAPLASRDVNITRIESRPGKRVMWEYIFFIDVEGHVSDPRLRAALEEMSRYTEWHKVLGSYPAAPAVETQGPFPWNHQAKGSAEIEGRKTPSTPKGEDYRS